MQKVNLLFVLFSFLNAESNASDSLWNIILKQKDRIEGIENFLFPQYLVCPTNETNEDQKKEHDIATKCAKALCGPANNIENYKEMVERIENTDVSKTEEKFNKKYDALANEIIDLSIERNKLLQPIYAKMVEDKNINFNSYVKKIRSISVLFPETIQFIIKNSGKNSSHGILEIKKENEQITININEDNLNKTLEEKFKNDPFNLKKAIGTMAKTKAVKSMFFVIFDIPVPSILREMEGAGDWREIFKTLAEKTKKQIHDIAKIFDISTDEEELNLLSEKELNEISSGQFPRQEALTDTLILFYTTDVLYNIFKNPERYPEYIKAFDMENYSFNALKNFDWEKRFNALNSVKKIEERKALDIAQCKARRDFTLAALPTKSQIDSLSNMINSTKQKFKKKLFSKFSQASSSILSTKIDNISFIPPISKEYYKKKILSEMKDERDDLLDNIKSLKKGNGEKYEMAVLLGMPHSPEIDSYFTEKGDLTDEIHELLYYCTKYVPETLKDSYWPFKVASIYISWNSICSENFGKDILYHEMGHAMSPLFKSGDLSKKSTDQYYDTRSCLNKNHVMGQNSREDLLYTEEDWADLVTSVISEKAGKNMGCFLMSQKDNKYNSNYIHLENPNKEDSHSAHFYRILQMHLFQNDEYPVECENFLATRSEPYPVINCRRNLDLTDNDI